MLCILVIPFILGFDEQQLPMGFVWFGEEVLCGKTHRFARSEIGLTKDDVLQALEILQQPRADVGISDISRVEPWKLYGSCDFLDV